MKMIVSCLLIRSSPPSPLAPAPGSVQLDRACLHSEPLASGQLQELLGQEPWRPYAGQVAEGR